MGSDSSTSQCSDFFCPNSILVAWHFDSEAGEILTDEVVFNEDKTLYAQSKKLQISLTLTGDSNVTVVTSPLLVDKGATWAEIQAAVNAAISFAVNYGIDSWHFDSESGMIVSDEDVFDTNKTLFAKSCKVVVLTLKSNLAEVTLTESEIKVKFGTKLGEIKTMLADKVIVPNENIQFTGWRINTAMPGFLTEDFSFYRSDPLTAISEPSKFLIDESGTITQYNGSDKKLYIPIKIGSKKVTAIGRNVFKENSTIEQVDFSTVTHLTTLERDSFYKCPNLIVVTFPSSLEEIKDGYGVGTKCIGCFAECPKLNWSLISTCKKLTRIGTYAFYHCSKPMPLDLSKCESLTSIGRDAFKKSAVEKILFPASLQLLDSASFQGNEGIESLDFSACVNLETINNGCFQLCFSSDLLIDLSTCTRLAKISYNAFKFSKNAIVKLPLSVTTIIF